MDKPDQSRRGARIEQLIEEGFRGRIGRRRMLRGLLAAGMGLAAAREMAENAAQAQANQAARRTELEDAYDFVIVGAGSAGSLLADRLSANGRFSVLVLEAGGEALDTALLSTPGAWGRNIGSDADWGWRSVPQAGLANRPQPIPVDRVIGGSGSINAMMWLRGDRSDYDAWERAAGPGWGWAAMHDAFRRIERVEEGDATRRGTAGQLPITRPAATHPLTEPFLAAAAEAGLPRIEINGTEQVIGAGHAEANIVGGRRVSPAHAFLLPALGRPNLTLISGARVEALEMDGTRCRGVVIALPGGTRRIAARREVVLAAGAIASPRLRLLAGIGPAEELRAAGVASRLDLPGVGRNLQDHLLLRNVVWATPAPLPAPMANAVSAMGYVRTDPALPGPDVQFVFGHVPAGSQALRLDEGWAVLVGLMKPRSRGAVRLASADPAAPPVIDPRHLSDPADVATLLRGLAVARQIGNAPALSAFRRAEQSPGAGDAAALAAFVAQNAGSYFHYAGTCAMGRGAEAVVDERLAVRGIEGLRIVDASVVPEIPAANTHAPTLMIAERAAALLLA